MIVDSERLTNASKALFTTSDLLYDAVKKVADESEALEPGDFTGIAELVEAARRWMDDLVAAHRCDIEDFAMFLAVHAETMVEADDYTASQFEQYASEFTEARGDAPAPVRPGPASEDRLVVDGESVAV
ncbi:hypothetical protein ACFQS3_18125 [Glycomyces mayteni]|uniref:Uncharacterized protein n=1 Tax=Glycomyces mayteni TaxID=543887 RepID=A0ABW2DD44_9ACTN|nr:hypothetical protein GCM10025732_00940 [Glycomyces mayteni]